MIEDFAGNFQYDFEGSFGEDQSEEKHDGNHKFREEHQKVMGTKTKAQRVARKG